MAEYPRDGTTAEELLSAVRQAAQNADSRKMIGTVSPETADDVPANKLVSVSAKSRELFDTAARVAQSPIPVLLLGETGTGKEVIARFLHHKSGREGPLRCINCGAIPRELVESQLFGHEKGAFTGAARRVRGLFEQAHRGTVLLDEIGELPPEAQAALLRVLETKQITRVGSQQEITVDVRVVAATNRHLEQMCDQGNFRWDLFYRLNAMTLELPPLRDRREDVLPMAETFVKLANKAFGCQVTTIDAKARRLLERYEWPGNIRELRNVVDRAVVIAQDATITPADLSERVRGKGLTATKTEGDDKLDIKAKVRRYEAQLLIEALQAHDWNQTATAKTLGMPLRTLAHKIKQHGISKRYDT